MFTFFKLYMKDLIVLQSRKIMVCKWIFAHTPCNNTKVFTSSCPSALL